MTITTPFATFYLDITEEHAEKQIGRALLRDGMITFDAIRSTRELLRLCRQIGTIVKHRDADENGITRIVKRSTEQSIPSYQAFTDSHLTLHTDGTVSIRFRYDSLGYYSVPVCVALPVFLDLLNQYKISFLLQKHQGYIIHNRRWLEHGTETL